LRLSNAKLCVLAAFPYEHSHPNTEFLSFSLAVNLYASFSPHCTVFFFLLEPLTGHFEHSHHGCISRLVRVFAWNLTFDSAA
jgi:hypothetical protein